MKRDVHVCPPLLSMRNREPPLEMQQLGPPAISLYVMRVSVVNPFNVIVPHTFNNMSFVVFTTGIVPIVPFFLILKLDLFCICHGLTANIVLNVPRLFPDMTIIQCAYLLLN